MKTKLQSNILLIGPPGAGKTACGQVLADMLSWTFLDTDQLIEGIAGKTIPEIFKIHGEAHFRQLESKLIIQLVERYGGACPTERASQIIATGGGMPVNPHNFQQLVKLGSIFYLQAPCETLFARIEKQGHRPLIESNDSVASCNVKLKRLQDILNSRASIYEKAHHTIDTSGLSPQEVAAKIMTISGYPKNTS